MSLKIVSNTGPLIHHTKIGALWLLKEIFGTIIIPNTVYEEAVLMGIKKGYKDAFVIKEAIEEGWIKIESVGELEDIPGLHRGETEAITLSKRMGAVFLSDDSSAREYAKLLGVKVHGSFWVIIEACTREKISKEEAMSFIAKLSEVMYVSSDVILFIISILNKKC